MGWWRCLFLVALGPAACDESPLTGPPLPNGTPLRPYGGTLVAEGTGNIHTLNLTQGGDWQVRINMRDAASVVPSHNELLTISDAFGSFATVEGLDLGTFGVKESFEWSDDESVGRVNSLAVSQDGAYLAALLEGYGSQYLEVLEPSGRRVVYSGLDIVTDNTTLWTPDNKLVFVMTLEHEGNPERWGAIGAIPLERFLASSGPSIEIDLYAVFTRAEWDALIYDIALSRDGTQLAYTQGRDLWVMDFVQGAVPHQLTTGPVNLGGTQFSPDASSLVVSAGGRCGLDETYIIPNHRNTPIVIDYGQGAGNEYLTGEDTPVEAVLAWLP